MASTREWFETVAEAQRRARRRRPRSVYLALAAGAEAGSPWTTTPATIRCLPAIADAAGGERGVSNVLEILRQGISETLYGLGKASVHDVTRGDVIVPDGCTLDHKP